MTRKITLILRVGRAEWDAALDAQSFPDVMRTTSCPIYQAFRKAIPPGVKGWVGDTHLCIVETPPFAYWPTSVKDFDLPEELTDIVLAFDLAREFPGERSGIVEVEV